ncbi:TPA: hypothetical protein ACTXXA_000263 [Legionella anisa]
MLTFKKLIIVLTAIPLFLANFSALAADQNQMNIFLISDPHVDITKRQATHINPRPGTSEELDQKSFDTLIAKIGEQIDLQQETNHAVILLGDLPAHNAYSRKTTRDDTNLVFE